MGSVVLGILAWQEGGDYVVLLIAIGALALWALVCWLVRRHRDGKVTLLDPDLFRLPHFRIGISGQMLQNITLGREAVAQTLGEAGESFLRVGFKIGHRTRHASCVRPESQAARDPRKQACAKAGLVSVDTVGRQAGSTCRRTGAAHQPGR